MKHAERALVEANHWPVLEPIEADGQVNPIALSKPVCVAGARSRVNLPLNSSQISRAHALFVADSDGVYVRDLASLNGVSVNNDPVRETVLHNGDVVRMGPFSFRCVENFPEGGTQQPHAQPAELRLIADGARVPLTRRTLLIGSREECDLHVSDEKVSPAHSVVFDRDARWFIRDLRSTTGTRVNGELVGEVKLEPADEIQVGNTRLTFAPISTPETEIDASLAAGMDEVSLAADDSLVPRPQPAESAPRPAEPSPARPSDDSAIIPLIEDENEKSPAPTPTPKPVEAAAAEPEITAPPLLDDSSLIPIALEPEPESPAAPPEPPHATAEELLESHPSDAEAPPAEDPPSDLGLRGELPDSVTGAELTRGKNESHESPAAPAYPGTMDRHKAEEVFSELLDELAQNVEEVQTVWEDLKTTDPDASAPRPEPSHRGK